MAMPIHERRALEEKARPTRKSNSKAALNNQLAQEQAAKRQEQAEEMATLRNKRDDLVERLDIGAARIEEARAQGKDVSSWEDYWIQLLRQYEHLCEQVREIEGE